MAKHVGWFILVVFLLITVWYVQRSNTTLLGGVAQTGPRFFAPLQRAEQSAGAAAPEEPTNEEQPKILPAGTSITFAGWARISAGRSRATGPEEEFVELRLSADAPAPAHITGWTLENSAGERATIGAGVAVLFPTPATSAAGPIVLRPGDKAFITTGRSPRSYSFRLNWCTGYLDQTRQYIPALARDCPLLSPVLESETTLTDACLDYIERDVPRCTPVDPPLSVSPTCREYVLRNASYKSCFEQYRDAEEFFSDEWRIFLNREKELWKASRETIILRDQAGTLIDRITY